MTPLRRAWLDKYGFSFSYMYNEIYVNLPYFDKLCGHITVLTCALSKCIYDKRQETQSNIIRMHFKYSLVIITN